MSEYKVISCESCRHSRTAYGVTECRRYPRQVQRVPENGHAASFFPVHNLDDWCGEWQPMQVAAT